MCRLQHKKIVLLMEVLVERLNLVYPKWYSEMILLNFISVVLKLFHLMNEKNEAFFDAHSLNINLRI